MFLHVNKILYRIEWVPDLAKGFIHKQISSNQPLKTTLALDFTRSFFALRK